jgi:putative transcriptional regulator
MKADKNVSFFQRLEKGLKDSIAYSRGELNLKTTRLPAPPLPASRQRVRTIRHRLRMSQSVFAAALNVSPKLVQSWEQGRRIPHGSDLRLLEIVAKKPQILRQLVNHSAHQD